MKAKEKAKASTSDQNVLEAENGVLAMLFINRSSYCLHIWLEPIKQRRCFYSSDQEL